MKQPRPRTFRIVVASSLAIALAGWWVSRTESSPMENGGASSKAVPAVAAQALADSANVAAKPVASPEKPMVPLFSTTGPTAGRKLNVNGAEAIRAIREGQHPEGRVTALDRGSFAALTKVTEGDRVRLPLAEGEAVEGTVQLVQHEGGNLRVAGAIDGERGTFALNTSGARVGGLIQFPGQQVAFRVDQVDAGEPVLREIRRADVVCAPLPRFDEEPRRAAPNTPMQAPPILSSRPNATAVLYLDFDGETVTDPAWNGGKTIVAPATPLSNADIIEIFNRVKEDFWPFNIDVTTNLTRYTSAPVGRRMRCIMTSNDAAGPGSGGVAYVNSFSNAGGGFFTSNIPCWVFNGGVVGVAEAISHEIGHTLGLSHDGRTSPVEEYYLGQGNGPTGWCPIMGAGYYKELVQWSKGEYANASNTEDDVTIISRNQNGFGYVADEAGDTRGEAASLSFNAAGDVNQTGIITKAVDEDYYQFGTTGGAIFFAATPAPISPDLDIEIEIQNNSGTVVTSANPTGALNATINTSLPAGTYYLVVRGVGEGNPTATGYSDYASIGAYTVAGNVPGGVAGPPAITSLGSVTGEMNVPFFYQIRGTDSPFSFGVTGTLPAGLSVNSQTGIISGTPTALGTTNVTITATNFAGTGSKPLTIQIMPPRPANLQPSALPGWSDAIVVSAVTGTNLDSGVIEEDDTVYIDFAVVNSGSLPVNTTFYNRLYVDGVLKQTFTVPSPFAKDQIITVLDYNIGQLAIGQHTIRVAADDTSVVSESDETDNSYTRIITVIPQQFSNLKPTQPPGWSDKIVVSSVTKTNTDGPNLSTSATLFVDYAVLNTGPATVTSPFATEIFIDDELFTTIIKTPPVGINIVAFDTDINIGRLAVGQHTIRIKVDSTNSVTEGDETDNEYTRTFNVVTAMDPNLTFKQPDGWSGGMVLSRIVTTHVDTPIITTIDPIYLDFAVQNNGNTTLTSSWTAKVYVDDLADTGDDAFLKVSIPVTKVLQQGSSFEVNDQLIPPLPAGEHVIKVVLDAGNTVAEANETAEDNKLSRTITVVAPTATVDSATFVGLIRPAAGGSSGVDQFGLATFKVSGSGSFTGKLSVGGKKFSVKGALNAYGDSGFGKRATDPTALLKRGGAAPLILDFRLGGPVGGEQLLGDVSAAGLALGDITAYRVIYSGAKNPVAPLTHPPVELVSPYTALFPAKTPAEQGLDASAYPQGAGVAFGGVDKNGVVKLSGTLADGAKFSMAAPIVTDGRFPFHALMDKNHGVVNGMVDLRTQAGVSDFDASNLTWLKLPNPKGAVYKSGWSQGLNLDLVGSKYVRAKNDPALPWLAALGGAGNAVLTLTAGGILGDGQTANLNIDTKNKVAVVGGNTTGLKVKFNAKSGSVSGEFQHPVTGKKTKFTGAIQDAQHVVGGYFLSGEQSGDVEVSAAE